MSTIDRGKAKQMGQEAVRIIHAGWYTTPDDRKVSVADAIMESVHGTVSYPPDTNLPTFASTGHDTQFEVTNETTLSAAQRLVADGLNPVALNFASAKHPGGGFLGGARAQEESLCRSSGLYACIVNDAMYRQHASTRGGFYTNYAIYSPGVPVFRDDDDLLSEPYRCAFVTSPAVNAGTFLGNDNGKQPEVTREMRVRIRKVLDIMAGHGHDAVVLGAWGCGVFRNDPEVIADLFRDALRTRFAGVFKQVVFAILDSRERGIITPFAERFR